MWLLRIVQMHRASTRYQDGERERGLLSWDCIRVSVQTFCTIGSVHVSVPIRPA